MSAAETKAEQDLKYLLSVLKNGTAFEPDWHATAAEHGVSSANVAQKRFKAIVEKSGAYKLVNGKIIDAGGSPAAADAPATPPPKTPRKRKNTMAAPPTPTPKKTKKDKEESDGDAVNTSAAAIGYAETSGEAQLT